ncbi:hypothetical protein DC094_18490 [Pelagibaculum spongiae]|uniref:Uncharacterized protein n=2 Tax=Pelagibaculum spongiae TaxID=2080658 RepID=A0A2V1GWR4_9GAMM|nr:hypothetical protein DC094_18490 [Pelagibaculum spongiae]
MPIINKKDSADGYNVSRVCLHDSIGRVITVLKTPIEYDMKFHGRVDDIIALMKRTADVIICNCKDEHGNPASSRMPDVVVTTTEGEDEKLFSAQKESLIPGIYVNISEYKKEKNTLSYLAKGTVDYLPVSATPIINAVVGAGRIVALASVKGYGFYKYFHKTKKINLVISDEPTGDISIKIKRQAITFTELADVMEGLQEAKLSRSSDGAATLARRHTRPLFDIVIFVANSGLTHAFQ